MNWKILNKSMDKLGNPTVYGVCDEGGLELGKDPVPQITVSNFLKMIGRKTIIYENTFLMIKWMLL